MTEIIGSAVSSSILILGTRGYQTRYTRFGSGQDSIPRFFLDNITTQLGVFACYFGSRGKVLITNISAYEKTFLTSTQLFGFTHPLYIRYMDTRPSSTTHPSPSDLKAAEDVWFNTKEEQFAKMEAALSDVHKEAFDILKGYETDAPIKKITGLEGAEYMRFV